MDSLHLKSGVRGLISPVFLAGLLTGCGHMPVIVIMPHDALSAEEHTRLGVSYEEQGLRADAHIQFEAALEKDPNYAPAWMAKGNDSFAAGDLKSAERSFRRVLKLSPHHAGASNNLAMIYVSQNINLDEAEQLAQEALAQDGPIKPYLFDTLANIYLRQRRYPDAKAALTQAEEAAPPDNAAVRDQLLKTRALIAAAEGAEAAR